jgi:hypothetical protein
LVLNNLSIIASISAIRSLGKLSAALLCLTSSIRYPYPNTDVMANSSAGTALGIIIRDKGKRSEKEGKPEDDMFFLVQPPLVVARPTYLF